MRGAEENHTWDGIEDGVEPSVSPGIGTQEGLQSDEQRIYLLMRQEHTCLMTNPPIECPRRTSGRFVARDFNQPG